MLILCANHSSNRFHAMAKHYPLGWLLGPAGYKTPRPGLPFALDNDMYSNWLNGKDFNYPAWIKMLDKVRTTGIAPMWVAVPDTVADRKETLRRWNRYAPVAACYDWPLAFVVQDGMTPEDVPDSASVVFVGGSTEWKWRNLSTWVNAFPRVHVGRCGTSRWKLDRLEELGVESCDGSGFFRATAEGREARHLLAHLAPDKHRQLNML